MNSMENQVINEIIEIFNKILNGKKPKLIEKGDYSEPINTLVKTINDFILSYYEIWDFMLPLSNGILNVEPPKSKNILSFPFKELHSQLRNLVWQVQQVAKGDYNQKVYFMGEFAEAFNKMVDALDEKEKKERDDRKRLEENIYYLENYDALTKVPNRKALEKSFDNFFPVGESCINGAMFMIDIDNLQFINETFGHSNGDMVLINLASVLKENIRSTHFLTRLGGDEFLVLLKDVSEDDAISIAEDLRRAVEKVRFFPPNYYDDEISYTISLGVVPFCSRKLGLKELMSLADFAVYKAKELGRNCVYKVTKDTKDNQNKIDTLLFAIRKAIETENLVIFFQPVVNIVNGQIVHHEALMRIFRNNEIIYPDKAVTVAERFGLMLQIDKLILKKSFKALCKYPELKLFINLSGSSIGDEDILTYIINSLRDMNIDPSRVGFEITETMEIKDLSHADKWMRKLKDIGCRFAIDDFGIGFSTFSYLQYLPVDYVKIDGSYVKDMEKSNQNRALVKAINTVAESLGKQVIAEYVENGTVLDILKEDGISLAQGYYFGKAEEVPNFTLQDYYKGECKKTIVNI